MVATRRTTSTTSTLVSETPPVPTHPSASRFWSDVKYVGSRATLVVAIVGPLLVSGEFVYFKVIAPAQATRTAVVEPSRPRPTIPAPFVDPGIIVVQPPAETRVETETTTVPPTSQIPESQRRGKHARPDEVAPVAPTTPPRPTGSRRVAPSDVPSLTPTPTTTPPPAVSSLPPAPPPPSSSAPTVTSPTPIYDQLRQETLARNPTLPSSVIPE